MRQLSSSRPFYAGVSAGYLAPAPALLHARISLSFIFFVNGFVVASWLPHIPEVKERLALGDFRLGLALFAMAAGSVLALPVAGWFVGRCGSHVATGAAGLALCLLLPAPVAAPNLPLLMLTLFLFGAANGLLDVSMNAQAVSTEDRYPQPILSSCTGFTARAASLGRGSRPGPPPSAFRPPPKLWA